MTILQNLGKNWGFFKILGTIWKIIIFSKILKNNHFFSQNWEKSSFYAKILKNHHFFPKSWKKHHFFTKIWKNYHFYQSLIVSHKYPILVSNILVSNSIQYWYQILACLNVLNPIPSAMQPLECKGIELPLASQLVFMDPKLVPTKKSQNFWLHYSNWIGILQGNFERWDSRRFYKK